MINEELEMSVPFLAAEEDIGFKPICTKCRENLEIDGTEDEAYPNNQEIKVCKINLCKICFCYMIRCCWPCSLCCFLM